MPTDLEKLNAVKIAYRILESNQDFLDNVHALWRAGNGIYGQCWNTEFHVFGVIESDSDHLPLNHVRQHCSTDFLAKVDKEVTELITFYKSDVVKACREIISKHKEV